MQRRLAVRGAVGRQGRVEQPARVRRIVAARTRGRRRPRRPPGAGWRRSTAGAARASSGPRAASTAAAPTRVPCTRWNAIPAYGGPAGTCIRSSQSSCQRHSSPATPRSAPPRCAPRGARKQFDRRQQLPRRHRAAGDVLAVIAGVVPAARHVESARARPARIQPLRVGPRHASTLASPAMARRTPVSGRAGLVDRHARALQVEERQRVAEPAADTDRRRSRTGDCARRPRRPRTRRPARAPTRSRARAPPAPTSARAGRPRHGPPLHDRATGTVAEPELGRLYDIGDPHRVLRTVR